MSPRFWLLAAVLATGVLLSGCSSASAPSLRTASATSPSGPTDAEKASHLAAAQAEASLGAAAYEAADWYATKDHYFNAYLEYSRAGLRSDPAVRECQTRASEAVRQVRLMGFSTPTNIFRGGRTSAGPSYRPRLAGQRQPSEAP